MVGGGGTDRGAGAALMHTLPERPTLPEPPKNPAELVSWAQALHVNLSEMYRSLASAINQLSDLAREVEDALNVPHK